MPGLLVIGVGTLDGGDDAAGRLVAQGLRGHPGIAVAESAGIAADILMHFDGHDRVLVVDACRSGAEPGTVLRLDGHRDALPALLSPTSSHGMGVAEAVALARALGLLPPSLAIWAVEGASFTLGAGLHPAVGAAIPALIAQIAALA
jgi:hydrogenase maturation protease